MRLFAFLCSLILSISPYLPDDDSNILADLGLDVRIVSEKEKESLLEACDFQITRGQETKKGINGFAVETEVSKYIYLAFDDNCIDVYSMQEHYEYSIWFRNFGCYEIFCHEGMFYLYLVRGSWLLSFDQNGKVSEVFELNSSSRSSNDEVLDQLCSQTKYVVDGKTFEVGNESSIHNPFSAAYSSLNVTDQTGANHYLYQASTSQFWAPMILALAIFLFVVLLISKASEARRKYEKNQV